MGFYENFKASWKKSNRLLVVFGGIVVVFGGLWYFGAGQHEAAVSDIRSSNQRLNGTITSAVTPEMNENQTKADVQRVVKAETANGSAMPTVRLQPVIDNPIPAEKVNPEVEIDKLPRPTPPQIDRPTVNLAPIPTVPAPVPFRMADNSPQIEQAATAMRGQLADLGKVTYAPADVKYYYKPPAAAGVPGQPGVVAAAGAYSQSATGTAPSSGMIGSIQLPLPGAIVYAELIGEANSDVQGPVLARVLQGELAGATLIGTFSPMRETLVLKFTTLSMGTSVTGEEINKSIAINAVGVDSKTISPGVATDVDHHLITNVGITAASAFASGFGSAIAQSGQTITNTAGYGTQIVNPTRTVSQQLYVAGGAAAGAVGSTLTAIYGNRPTTITIAAGSPVGILFMPNQNQ